MKVLGQRARWWCWWLSNYRCRDCISRRCSKRAITLHPTRSFHCRSRLPCDVSASGRVAGAGGCPTIRAGIVSPTGVQIGVAYISIRPRRSFRCQSTLPCEVSGRGRVGGAGGCPTIRARIVSPAGVQNGGRSIHPRRSFHCRSRLPCESLGQWARWWCWWLSNYPCRDCISRRCSKSSCRYNHPRRSFHCRSRPPCEILGPEGALVVLVAVQLSVLGLYLPPVLTSQRIRPSPQMIISLPVHTAV